MRNWSDVTTPCLDESRRIKHRAAWLRRLKVGSSNFASLKNEWKNCEYSSKYNPHTRVEQETHRSPNVIVLQPPDHKVLINHRPLRQTRVFSHRLPCLVQCKVHTELVAHHLHRRNVNGTVTALVTVKYHPSHGLALGFWVQTLQKLRFGYLEFHLDVFELLAQLRGGQRVWGLGSCRCKRNIAVGGSERRRCWWRGRDG